MTVDLHPLATFLEFAVPLKIIEYQEQGGPTSVDVAQARSQYSEHIGFKGDVLLFGGGQPGEAAQSANWLVNCLAILAFEIGGVTAFGRHWEVVLGEANWPGI